MAKIPYGITIFSRMPFSKRLLAGSTFILLYHEVSKQPSKFHRECNLAMGNEQFEEQIAFYTRNFHALSPPDLLKGNYPTPAFLVTFDDGAAGYFENALPLLNAYSCPSIIFLNMAAVKGEIFRSGLVMYLMGHVPSFREYIADRKYPDPLFLYVTDNDIEMFLGTMDRKAILSEARNYYGPFATEAMLEKCQNNRLVYFGNHLYNHHNAAVMTKDELVKSFHDNQAFLSGFPNSIPFFSYPFGQQGSCYNSETDRILKNEGARAIFSANPLGFRGHDCFFHRLPMTTDFTERNLSAYLIGKRIQAALKNKHDWPKGKI